MPVTDEMRSTVAAPRRPSARDPWRVWFPVALVGVLILAVVSVRWGTAAILSNTEGNLVRTVDDPAEPGYEAIVEPTPVLVVAVTTEQGQLGAALLASLAGSSTGGVIVVSPETLVGADGQSDSADDTLADQWESGGLDAVREAVSDLLNVGVGESRHIAADQWQALVGPVAPLEIENPDAITGASGTTYAAGTITLGASEVADYLDARSRSESDLNRMIRQQQFWAAWLASVGRNLADPAVVPGESDTGLGRFVRSLAAVEVEFATLPVRTTSDGLLPEPEAVAELVARIVPFPVGASPESRVRIRILDGTGRLANGLGAVPVFVSAGAEVATLGNATTFSYGVTQFIVAADGNLAEAEALRDALGVGEIVTSSEQASAVDVTVVLGSDAVPLIGGS